MKHSSEQFKTGLGHMAEHRQELEQDPVGFFLEQRGVEAKASSDAEFDFLPPEHRAEILWAMFQEVKSGVAKTAKKEESSGQDDDRFSLLLTLYNDPKTKEVYLREVERHIEEKKLMNGSYEKYRALGRQIRMYEDDYDRVSGKLFASRGKRASERDKLAYRFIKNKLEDSRAEMRVMLSEYPRLATQASYERIADYRKQLDREGFMWLPSRRAILEKMESASLSGRPVLLLGESGTGKTSLVRAAATNLTGEEAFKAQGGPSTRLQDSLRKQAVGEGEKGGTKTYLEFGELAQAMTGMERSDDAGPKHEGGVYFDDEFNNRARDVQMEIIKAVSGIDPGRDARLPLVGKIHVQPRYLFVAAGNPPNERYDRQPMDPAVRREFGEAITVDYPEQTADDPELYEAMLASLMDRNGRLRFAHRELSPAWKYRVEGNKKIRELDEDPQKGGALWRFAEAMNELYKSFSRKETVLDDKGEAQYLSEFVLDPGVVFGWLRSAVEEGYTGSLEGYLNAKIESKLSEAGIPQADTELAREFFRHFGLLEKSSDDKSEPDFSPITPGEIGLLSPRVRYKERIAPEITEGSAIIKGRSVRYKTEGTEEAPVDAVRISGKGVRAKRWRVLGRTDDGDLVIHSDDMRRDKYKLVSPDEFLSWEAGVDSDALLAGLDMGKLPPDVRKLLEPGESRPEFRELMESEREKLKEFFGEEIKVPPLPESITPKRVEEWKEMKFELHYLPKYELAEEVEEVQSDGTKKKVKRWKSLPGWENKLKVGPDQLHSELPGGWVLMDTRQKPSYTNGTQMYENDKAIGEKIKALREDKDSHIEKSKRVPSASRFKISFGELDKQEVREALAEALGIKPEELDLAYGAENSVLMHMHMPSWGNTNTSEWFKDKTKDGRRRFCGGVSAYGGLANVNLSGVDARVGRLGFRPLGRFSS